MVVRISKWGFTKCLFLDLDEPLSEEKHLDTVLYSASALVVSDVQLQCAVVLLRQASSSKLQPFPSQALSNI